MVKLIFKTTELIKVSDLVQIVQKFSRQRTAVRRELNFCARCTKAGTFKLEFVF